jgi:microcystin-dependent protein
VAEPFLSEIRIMSFVFAPKFWALCNGQFLPINQNQALFALLGTTFGGNGQTTFALPNLQGRAPVHVGSGLSLGQQGGEQAHTLTLSEMPQHLHLAQASSTDGDTPVGGGALLASSGSTAAYGAATNLTSLLPGSISNVGGSQAHTNQQPFLTLSFCIALAGIFPSPN